jgi:hypothetical protein
MVVSGDSESGVTSALIWILSDNFKKHEPLLPVYLGYTTSLDRKRYDRAIVRAAERTGLIVGSRDELPSVVLAVDDITDADIKALGRFLDRVAQDTSTRFVLGCHGDSAHAAIAAGLEARAVSYAKGFLAPFGQARIAGTDSKDRWPWLR